MYKTYIVKSNHSFNINQNHTHIGIFLSLLIKTKVLLPKLFDIDEKPGGKQNERVYKEMHVKHRQLMQCVVRVILHVLKRTFKISK